MQLLIVQDAPNLAEGGEFLVRFSPEWAEHFVLGRVFGSCSSKERGYSVLVPFFLDGREVVMLVSHGSDHLQCKWTIFNPARWGCCSPEPPLLPLLHPNPLDCSRDSLRHGGQKTKQS